MANDYRSIIEDYAIEANRFLCMNLSKVLIIAMLAAITGCSQEGNNTSANRSAGGDTQTEREPITRMTSTQLQTEIDKVFVQAFTLEDVELEGALHYLIKRGGEAHPNAFFEFPFEIRANLTDDMTVTVRERDIPYSKLISRVCEAGKLRWEIEDGCIVIKAVE